MPKLVGKKFERTFETKDLRVSKAMDRVKSEAKRKG